MLPRLVEDERYGEKVSDDALSDLEVARRLGAPIIRCDRCGAVTDEKSALSSYTPWKGKWYCDPCWGFRPWGWGGIDRG